MKVLERTKEIKEVYGYESGDGIYFKTEEECRKYEETARYAINKAFFDLCVRKNKNDTRKTIEEWALFEGFGNGSDYEFVILEVKNEEDLKTVNMYRKEHLSQSEIERGLNEFDKKYIGQRVLVAIGDSYSGYDNFYIYGTLDEMVEKFKKQMNGWFNPVIEEQTEQN